ncbi:protein NEOXANTHIN-DEFICIENT 1 isoform X2 [Malania oleifera]|uniref:protein NEOXANTHIN-DEFICIENT 1 isoform X2 n=1 Tax=Malania oleifera TaxID=397392 RepID=UPI0025AECD49|nr:protein NEOXANTHIN-DEFICIENT 1 isoform X2 [Malania oleifera]
MDIQSALYQLHLVKAETARALIPKEFRLVEAFGYTLGGFFLASYDHSPTGMFDELVVIAGIVWNQPTSCAWAARVLVNSDEACVHGRKAVGLPSHVAKFSKTIKATPRHSKRNSMNAFLDMVGWGPALEHRDVQVIEINGPAAIDICTINYTTAASAVKFNKGTGPVIKMSLPSFSGHTKYNPNLLKYSCKMECRVRAVKPVKVSGPSPAPKNDKDRSSDHGSLNSTGSTTGDNVEIARNLSISVMLSKPILALEFSCLKMQVEAPIIVSHCSKNS